MYEGYLAVYQRYFLPSDTLKAHAVTVILVIYTSIDEDIHIICPTVANDRLYFLPLQSGQYHLLLLGGLSVKPTHEKWNHNPSHCRKHVNAVHLRASKG